MKNRVTRWGVMIAAVCSLMLFPALTGYAADGTLMLSDPTGSVGAEIPVTVRIDAGGQPIGDANVTLSYDPAMLEFVSGTNAQGGEGTVTLAASGTGTETELAFELTFKGVAEGTAAIQVTESTAYLFSDETLNLTAGEAAVTIGPGDGTAAASESTERVLGTESIEIGGMYYNIYENFSDALIPAGFSRSTVQYAGAEHAAIRQDTSGKVFLFMISGDGDPIMVLYNESDSTFVLAERVDVSESFYILILASGDGSTLPEAFVETSLSLHDMSFPAWQNMDSMEFYLMYALSSSGVEGFYQYDSIDGTYQRYVAQTSVSSEPEEEEDDSALGKVEKIITDNLLILALAVAVIVVILFIIILVLSIKLGRRNAELEDMYVGDEEENKPNVKKKSRQQFVGYDDEDDEEEDYLEDDFDDSDYDDEFTDSEDNYDDEFDDDDEYYDDDYEDEEDVKEYTPGKGDSAGKKESYEDIDFIDV